VASLEGTNVGPYEMKVLLGAGGMGQVYRARDPRLDREVAIKVLTDALSKEPGYLERFRREARAVAKLNHPNIVQVYDFGEQGDLTYLVMPLMTGGTLRDYLAHRRILPLSEALSIMEQVGGALQYAHERGLVHRDVKPANILMSAEGRALLSDFGIVRLVQPGDTSATLTRKGAFVGSPEYAAPEMVVGDAVDHRADIYALGVMLFQMLTGQLPFIGSTPVALMMMHAQQQPPKPRSLNADIPPAVEAVMLKALAKQPAERYQTMAEFLAALRAASAAPAVEARPAQVRPGDVSDLPTVATYGTPQAPGSGPAVYSPSGLGSGPPPAWVGPSSGPSGWAPQGSGPSGWAPQGSGPSGWAPGSGPAVTPPLPPTYVTGLAGSPSQPPSSQPPSISMTNPTLARRRRRATSVLLVVLALVVLVGGGATLALAASNGLLFKGGTATPSTTAQRSPGATTGTTPTAGPSPTPTPVPTAFYKAQYFIVMNQDLQGDTVSSQINVGNNYEADEGTNGTLYQNGSADMFNVKASFAYVVNDSGGTRKFVVLVDRLNTYQDAQRYFQLQQSRITSQSTPLTIGEQAVAGVVAEANGKQTYQLFVRDRNIFITIATVQADTAANMSAYFSGIAQAMMTRGQQCLYSEDANGNLTKLSSSASTCQ
jgi:serine/threonine protein kinase